MRRETEWDEWSDEDTDEKSKYLDERISASSNSRAAGDAGNVDDYRKRTNKGGDSQPTATNPALSISDIDATFTKYQIHVHEIAFDSGIRVISHEVVTEG